MIKSTRLMLTLQERQLLKAVEDVVFGEITDAEIANLFDIEYLVPQEVSAQKEWLINLVRSGVQNFAVIQIHNSEPTQVEITSVLSGFNCRRKIRPI